jgi:hypothetical protein
MEGIDYEGEVVRVNEELKNLRVRRKWKRK